MKRVYLFVIVYVMVFLCGCKVRQTAVQQQQPQTNVNNSVPVELPCHESGFDDADYYRGIGTAVNINMQKAHIAALQNAKAIIREKLGGFVSGVSRDYTVNMAGDSKQTDVHTVIESQLTVAVEKVLNDAELICEKVYVQDDGNYEYWVAIQIPKKMLVDNMLMQLDGSESLDFDADQFLKYTNDKINNSK